MYYVGLYTYIIRKTFWSFVKRESKVREEQERKDTT